MIVSNQSDSLYNHQLNSNDYLIDDYTKNLIDWKQSGGTGIKFLNGINHTNKTWQGLLLTNDNSISHSLNYMFNKSESILKSDIDFDIADEFC